MRTIPRTIVAAVIISKDGSILFGKKDPNSGGVYVDRWHIPGGGVKSNETNAQALHREILEEVGIDISRYTLKLLEDKDIGVAEKTDKETGERFLCEMHFYTYQIDLPTISIQTKVILSDDLVEFRWVAKDDVFSLELTPPSVKLFTNLGWDHPKS